MCILHFDAGYSKNDVQVTANFSQRFENSFNEYFSNIISVYQINKNLSMNH